MGLLFVASISKELYAPTLIVPTRHWSLNVNVPSETIRKLGPRNNGIHQILATAVRHPGYHVVIKKCVEYVNVADNTNEFAGF